MPLRLLLLVLACLLPTSLRAADAPQLKSVQVSPSGGVLLARFSSNVASVKAGATYSVNGDPPIALTDPLYDNPGSSDWAWWPLGPRRQLAVLDDDRDSRLDGAGWTNKNPSNTPFLAGYFFFKGDQFSQTAAPADSANYATTLPVAGRWRLSANLTWLYGPDRTTKQVYTVSDGAGVVATFTVDLTQPPSYDRVDNLIRYHDLGHVTLRDTSLTVKVANGATAGTLVTDALYLELDLPPPVAPGDTVTLSAPAGTFTTTTGPVGAVAAAPVAHAADAEWFPFDPARKPTMEVGYNKTGDYYFYNARLYANRFLASTGWTPVSGTFSVDANDDLTAIPGRARSLLWTPTESGTDAAGWPVVPSSGTVVLRFKNPAGAVDPGCTLEAVEGGPYNFGPRTWDPTPGADGKSTLKFSYSRPGFVPLGQATTPYYPQLTSPVALYTTKVITDVECHIEPETPAGYTLLTDPTAIERYRGRGFGALRFLDAMNGNWPQTTEFTDWPAAGVNGLWWSDRPQVDAAVASISPIDADDAAKYCKKYDGTGWVRITTTAPHGLATGQIPEFRGPAASDRTFPSNVPDGAGGFFPIVVGDGNRYVVVTGPTTLLYNCSYPHGAAPEVPGPPTLGEAHKLVGYRLVLNHDRVVPYADLMTFARETGVGPWVIVPHLMSDVGIAAMADATLAGIPAGTKVRVEYSNETWNTGFGQMAHLEYQRYHFAYLDSIGTPAREVSDPTGSTTVVPRNWMESYCHFAANAHRVFAEKFAAAGRSADLRRVMGAQASYSGFPTQSIADYAFEHNLTFDELAIETYVGSHPAQTRQYATDPTPAYDRLDVDGLIDVLGVCELLGGRDREFAAHRRVLAGNDSNTGKPFGSTFAAVKLVSYEGGASEVVQGVSETGRRRYQLAHRVFRNPRMYRWELAQLQNLDVNCGCALAVRYNADKTDSQTGDQMWVDWPSYGGGVGTGDPAENRNPWDALAHRPQTAGAMRTWAAAMGTQPPAPTPTPAPTPASNTLDARIAEVEAAAAALAKAEAAGAAAWVPHGAAIGAARARMAKASAALAGDLTRVGAGAAYRRDPKGDGVTIYLPDGKTIRPVPAATPVPAGAK
jgi:hypothetical protein